MKVLNSIRFVVPVTIFLAITGVADAQTMDETENHLERLASRVGS